MRQHLETLLRQVRRQDGFRGPVLTLLSGSAVALVLSYLAQPVLTRLYTPAAFGLADYFTSLMVILMSVSSLRYEDALMQPETEEEAGAVWWLAVAVLVVSTALCVLLLPWRAEIAALLGVPNIAPWLLLVPPTLLAMRVWKLTEVWLTRDRKFRLVSVGQVANVGTMSGSRILAGLASPTSGPLGLIGGFFLGHLAGAVLLTVASVRHTGDVLRRAFQPHRWWEQAKRFRRFPLFSTPSTLFGALLSRLPFLLIPVFFDEAVLGFFGRAFLALAIPLSFVGNAIAQVFFVQAAEAQRSGTLPELTEAVHARLVMLGIFPTLALMLAGGDIFEVVFGETWRPAGDYLLYLGPWLFLAAVASPLTRLFDVLERQRLDFISSAILFALLAVALFWSGPQGDVLLLLQALGVAGVASRLIHLGILLFIAEVSYLEAARTYGRYVLFSIPGLLLLAIGLFCDNAWVTTGTAVVAGLSYVLIVQWKDKLLTP